MLTPEEALALWDELVELADEIRACRDANSSGGKRITKKELRGLAWKSVTIGVKIIGDVLD